MSPREEEMMTMDEKIEIGTLFVAVEGASNSTGYICTIIVGPSEGRNESTTAVMLYREAGILTYKSVLRRATLSYRGELPEFPPEPRSL